jgi:hypothetical protein
VTRDPNAPGPGFDGEPEELAPLDPNVERELFEMLRSAWDPAPLDPVRHRRILEQALEDPFAEPSDEEVRESARLRRALEGNDPDHPDVELARALRSTVAPSQPKPGAVPLPASVRRPVGGVIYATFGAVTLAAAAGFALFVTRSAGEPVAASAVASATAGAVASPTTMHASRPTGDLFGEAFKTGGTTDRIDRIAAARGHDLRENRYLAWGVR